MGLVTRVARLISFFAGTSAAMVDFPDVIWHFETVENTISRLFVNRLPMKALRAPIDLAFTHDTKTEFHLQNLQFLQPN